MIGKLLALVFQQQRRAFGSGFGSSMIEVGVDDIKDQSRLAVPQLHPTRNARQSCVPALAGDFVGRGRKPECRFVDQIKTFFAEEDGRKLSGLFSVVTSE